MGEVDGDDLVFVGQDGPRVGDGLCAGRERMLVVEEAVDDGVDFDTSFAQRGDDAAGDKALDVGGMAE